MRSPEKRRAEEGHLRQIVTTRRHSGRRLVVAIACAIAAATARHTAADVKPATPPATPPAEDGITAAKREFEAVKSARDPALQQRSDLPRLSLPEMRSDNGGAPDRSLVAPKSGQPEKKSANWLLEAMEKKDVRANPDRGTKSEREAAREVVANESRHETAQRTDTARQVEVDRKLLGAPPDPMAKFLSGWMTPQDYALLKPGLEQSLSYSLSAGTATVAGALPGVASPEAALAAAGPNGPGSLVGGTKPRENPYLSALNLTPAPVAPLPAGPVVTVPSSPPPALLPVPAPIAPPKPKLPEFAKPAQDEKYYKQLKRF